jgi:hypothetical protein
MGKSFWQLWILNGTPETAEEAAALLDISIDTEGTEAP